MTIEEADRRRLALLLGMLGSEFDGERAAAALKVDTMVKRLRLTWNDILGLPPIPTAPEPAPRAAPDKPVIWDNPYKLAVYIEESGCSLNEWESAFVTSIATRSKALSARQAPIVQALLDRAEIAWTQW